MTELERFRPVGDIVLMKDIPENEKSAGGIFLPKTAQIKILQGQVLKVGPGLIDNDGQRVPTIVKPGDKVAYAPYVVTPIKFDGTEYWICHEHEILATFE